LSAKQTRGTIDDSDATCNDGRSAAALGAVQCEAGGGAGDEVTAGQESSRARWDQFAVQNAQEMRGTLTMRAVFSCTFTLTVPQSACNFSLRQNRAVTRDAR
jgi:hypothetical protein